jgi:cytoskeletal protein CcmA (bactofilin family)
MSSDGKNTQKALAATNPVSGRPAQPATLLTVVGNNARMEGKFDITDSIQIECEVGGEVNVGGKLVIGEKGVVNANVQTVDAVIMGHYEGNMIATGDVEITETGHVSGNIQTDSLVISKGGFFNGNVTKMNESASRQVLPIEEKLGAQQLAAATRAERDERILRG